MDDFTADSVDPDISIAVHDEMITITLEDSAHTYEVSKALLCNASGYFKNALGGHTEEARGRSLCLPGCDGRVFRLFMVYLLKKNLPDYMTVLYESGDSQLVLAKLWIFGDYITLPDLQNLAMKTLLQIYSEMTVDMDLVRLVYKATAEGSTLRTAVVGQLAHDNLYDATAATSKSEMALLSAIPGFLYDFTKASEKCASGELQYPPRGGDINKHMVGGEAKGK